MTASGQWLHSPIAVLKATDDSGNTTSALLALAKPHFNATAHTLTFKVRGLRRLLSPRLTTYVPMVVLTAP